MKKNGLTFVLFMIFGILLGIILTELLGSVPALAFLVKSAGVTWQPKGDFSVIKYDIFLQVRVNLLILLSLVGAFWIYRKI